MTIGLEAGIWIPILYQRLGYGSPERNSSVKNVIGFSMLYYFIALWSLDSWTYASLAVRGMG